MSCIFIGYDLKSKAYKFYEPKKKKVIISQDVEFQEGGIWNWNTNMVIIQDKEQIKEQTKEPTPPSSPTSSDKEGSTPLKTRSIQDLYEVTTLLNLIYLFANEEIIFFEDAIKDEKWRKAMNEEIKTIEKNETWELTSLPEGLEPIGVKWVFKVKKNAQGEVEKYKVRLVAKSYKQNVRIDYEEVFASVARMKTVRLVISLAAQNK